MSDFKDTVMEFGEDLLFETQIIKSSLTSSTKAVYSLTNRDCFVEGQTVKGSPSIANGDYFQRLSDDNTYFIMTLSPETFADDLFYMYATKCNAIISIQRNVEVRDEYSGDLISGGWQDVYTDVKCYRDVVTRTNKMTNDGGKDQTIYTLIIPHKYLISENDRVVMMSNQEGTEKLTNYKVESTGSQINGIDLVQMSLDLR